MRRCSVWSTALVPRHLLVALGAVCRRRRRQRPSDTLNNKPAVETITRWFGGSGQPQPAAAHRAAHRPPQPQPGRRPACPAPGPAPGQAGVNNPAFDARGLARPRHRHARSTSPPPGTLCSGAFHDYWKSHGGLALFGYPLSEEYREINATDGKPYTGAILRAPALRVPPGGPPRAPGAARPAGRGPGERAHRRAVRPRRRSPGANTATRVYFAQTGHTLGGRFLSYWQQYGGLAMFGYPLSEQFQEVATTDGKTYTVQYFERARFEYHPENAAASTKCCSASSATGTPARP